MHRRTFLAGLFAGAAVGPLSAVQSVGVLGVLRLYGDGITDDTAALQAAINGEKVLLPDGSPFTGYLPAGTYRITSPIRS